MHRLISGFLQRILWPFVWPLLSFFGHFKIIGQENIKSLRGPLILIANHRSYWDHYVIGTALGPFSGLFPMWFIASDRFFNNPIMALLFKAYAAFPAHKGEGLDKSLKLPRQVLRHKGFFVIYPYGRMTWRGRHPKPRRGAAILALEFPNVKIIPAYLKTVKGWGVKDFLLRRERISIILGKPFLLKEKTASQDIEEVTKLLIKEILRLRNKDKNNSKKDS